MALGFAPAAHAVLAFESASWTGPGTPDATESSPGTLMNVDAMTGTGDPIVRSIATGATSGTLNIPTFNNAAIAAPIRSGAGTSRVSSSLGASFGVSFTGGTGTVNLVNSSESDGGQGRTSFNSINLTNLAGVSRIDVDLSYSEFLSSRSPIPNLANNLLGLPTLVGVGVSNAGTSLNESAFQTTFAFQNAFSTTTPADAASFAPGIVNGVVPITTQALAFSGAAGNVATFNSTGFGGLVNAGGGALSPNFLLLRAFDTDGDGMHNNSDLDGVFASDRVIVSILAGPNGETFADDTNFVFSLDGEQFPTTTLVPEPSVMFLLPFAMGGLLRRRRA